MFLQFILLILGFVLLIKGADWLVDGACVFALKHKVSDLAVGLTVVAFGTSAPELVVNAFASYQQHYDIVYGNIIGSCCFNLFIILGLSGLITPLVVQSSTVWKEIPLSFFAIVLLFFISKDFQFADRQVLSRMDGLLLILMFGLFVYYVYKQIARDTSKSQVEHKTFSNLKIWGLILIGLIGLVAGGKIIVNSAVEIARNLGVSEKIIGLTILAAGTSLPELATSVVAAFKKNNDIAVGNIIGSNIFNIFLILGVSSLIRPIEYHDTFNTDFYLLALGTVLLFAAMFTGKRKILDRWEAGILFIIYTVYLGYLVRLEI